MPKKGHTAEQIIGAGAVRKRGEGGRAGTARAAAIAGGK